MALFLRCKPQLGISGESVAVPTAVYDREVVVSPVQAPTRTASTSLWPLTSMHCLTQGMPA